MPDRPCQRNLSFDKRGYKPLSAWDRTESIEEYYSALTTEYSFVYEQLKKNPNFVYHNPGAKDIAIFENKAAFNDYELYPARGIVVIGGIGAYDLLSLEKHSEGKIAPIFLAQSKNLARIKEILKVSEKVVFHNSDALDLFMLLAQGSIDIFQPMPKGKQKGHWQYFKTSHGIHQPFTFHDHAISNSVFGDLTISEHALTSSVPKSHLDYTIKIKKRGDYSILLRNYDGKDTSGMSCYINNKLINRTNAGVQTGYNWKEIWKGTLNPKKYALRLESNGDKPVYVDSVAVVETSWIEENLEKTLGIIKGLPITYMYNKNRLVEEGDSLKSRFLIATGGDYELTIKLSGEGHSINDSSFIDVAVDGVSIGTIDTSKGLGEYTFPIKCLSATEHTFGLQGLANTVKCDLLALTALAGREPNAINSSVTYKRTGHSKYEGLVSSEKPLLLVHTELNYPGWQMEVNNKRVTPIITNMFLNGFIVEEPGQLPFSVFYSNTAQRIGWVVTLVTLSGIVAYVVISPLAFRKSREEKDTEKN